MLAGIVALEAGPIGPHRDTDENVGIYRQGAHLHVGIEEAGGLVSTARLRRKFPRQAADKSLYRAIRGLRRAGAVTAHPDTLLGGTRLVLNFGHSVGDRELVRQSKLILRMLQTIAGAHGAPVPEEARALWEFARRS
jgi:hypothetical protein